MKLLTKTTLYFLIVMVPLLTVAGFYLFNRFGKEINKRSDKELVSDETEWINYMENQEEGGTGFIIKSPDLSIYPTGSEVEDAPTLTDIYGYAAKNKNKIPYRQLSQVVAIADGNYQIVIKQSQEQKAALVTDITRIMFFVFIGLFVATIIFNWLISERLWAPFRLSLKKIRNAELQQMQTLRFNDTSTQEFNELNASLNYMTGKIYRDYLNMKEFTENAAHEMQTPIAVVQSKLELLLQDTNLTDDQVQSILQSTTSLSRLSKLNQDLLLLAKIENNQYETSEAISLSEVTKKYLKLFDAFTKEKKLTIKTDFNDDFKIKLHPFLADTLIANLLGNAIKYNYDGGTVEIKISNDSYSITNTSLQKPIQPEILFSRLNSFNSKNSQSNGLGLAIVKKIIDTHYLYVDYAANNGIHRFTINK